MGQNSIYRDQTNKKDTEKAEDPNISVFKAQNSADSVDKKLVLCERNLGYIFWKKYYKNKILAHLWLPMVLDRIHHVRIFAIFYKTDKIASMLMRFVSQIS